MPVEGNIKKYLKKEYKEIQKTFKVLPSHLLSCIVKM